MVWSEDNKIYFVSLIKDQKDLLFGDYAGDNVTKVGKNTAWKEIAVKMKSRGAVFTDVSSLRRSNWDYMKQVTRTKYLNLRKSGVGGKEQLTKLDNMILDVVGRDSLYMVGIGNKSNPTSFAKKSKAAPLQAPSQTTQGQNETILSLGVGVVSMDGDNVNRNNNNINFYPNSDGGATYLNDSLVSTFSQFDTEGKNLALNSSLVGICYSDSR